MGGSGRNNSFDLSDVTRKIRTAEEETKSQGFEIEINTLINDLLKNFNSRDYEATQRHLNTIAQALHKEIEGSIDLRYGGSVSKHTYVDGLSDIDTLALINNSELSNKSPNEVKQYFYDMLVQRMPGTEISIGRLAITVKYKDGIEVQVLPAMKHGDHYVIPSPKGKDEWSHLISPKAFALSLRAVNQNMSGKLVPMIKLAKAIVSNLPDNRRLTGYHTEALAVEVFSKYNGPKTVKDMAKHFFDSASQAVLNPVKDKTGQSVHVDDYLGASNSVERKMASDSLAQIARRMKNADGGQNRRSWEDILTGE